jgi:hypothetical protein
MIGVSDTNTIRDCIFWGVIGTGIEIGRGSEIRIFGGRIIGDGTRTHGVGVLITGFY